MVLSAVAVAWLTGRMYQTGSALVNHFGMPDAKKSHLVHSKHGLCSLCTTIDFTLNGAGNHYANNSGVYA